MEDENRRKYILLILIALLVAFMAYFVAQNAQNTANNANQTANTINISNASYANNISALQINDTYFNGTLFPNSTNFRNNTMFDYFESNKVNKSNAGELTGGTLSDSRLSSNVPLKNTANTFTNTDSLTDIVNGDANLLLKNTALSGSPAMKTSMNTGNGAAVIEVDNNYAIKYNINFTGGNILRTYTFNPTNGNLDIPVSLTMHPPAAAQSNALCYNSGTGLVTYNAGVTTCLASNESLKTSISPVTASITRFAMNLTVDKYKYKYENMNANGGQWHIGLMAQDVLNLTRGTIFDGALVDYDLNGQITGLQYEEIVALELKVIQEQQTTINQQQTTLNKICSHNQSLCS